MTLQDPIKPDSIIKNHYGGYQRHSPRFIVGYWSIRGLGAPIRMLLSAAQINHWVVLYDVKEVSDKKGGGWDRSSYLRDKEKLNKEYPLMNLPFLIDCAEDKILCQTNAILAYLGRELKMLGTTKWEECRCEELLCEIMDVRNLMVRFAYQTETGTAKDDAKVLIENVHRFLERLERLLQQQYPDAPKRVTAREKLDTVGFHADSVCHLLKGQFTAPDFHLWEMLDQYEGLCRYYELPSCLGDTTTYTNQVDKINTTEAEKTTIFPHLKEFHHSFIQLIANQAYATKYGLNAVPSKTAVILPYNNSYARFGSDPQSLGPYQRGQEAPWKSIETQTEKYTKVESGIPYWDEEALQAATEKRKKMG